MYGNNRGPTCRCSMCGRKKASKKNNSRGLYIKNGLGRSEDNLPNSGSKKQDSRILRARMKRAWKKEEF